MLISVLSSVHGQLAKSTMFSPSVSIRIHTHTYTRFDLTTNSDDGLLAGVSSGFSDQWSRVREQFSLIHVHCTPITCDMVYVSVCLSVTLAENVAS